MASLAGTWGAEKLRKSINYTSFQNTAYKEHYSDIYIKKADEHSRHKLSKFVSLIISNLFKGILTKSLLLYTKY